LSNFEDPKESFSHPTTPLLSLLAGSLLPLLLLPLLLLLLLPLPVSPAPAAPAEAEQQTVHLVLCGECIAGKVPTLRWARALFAAAGAAGKRINFVSIVLIVYRCALAFKESQRENLTC
jgi:hypothetical protein